MIFPNFFHPFSFYEASLSILVKTVSITPLHVAFAWPFKMKFKALNFAALTMGAMVPDLEVLVYQLLGFCILTGWCCIFPRRRAERRDIVLTAILVKLLAHAKLEKIGISGFLPAQSWINIFYYFCSDWQLVARACVDSLYHEDITLCSG